MRSLTVASRPIPHLHCDRCRAGLVDAHSTNPVRHLLAFRLQLHGPEADRTKGPFKCYVTLLFWKLDPHPPPRNANNTEHYTFVTLFSRNSDTLPPLSALRNTWMAPNHRQLLRLFHLTPAVCRWSTHVVCTWIQLGRNYAHIRFCHWHWPQYYWAHIDFDFGNGRSRYICIAKFDHLSFVQKLTIVGVIFYHTIFALHGFDFRTCLQVHTAVLCVQ